MSLDQRGAKMFNFISWSGSSHGLTVRTYRIEYQCYGTGPSRLFRWNSSGFPIRTPD